MAAAIQAEIVQAGFANAHHLGFGGQFEQTRQSGFSHAFVVGVYTHGAPKIVISGGQSMDLGKRLQGGGNDQGAIHLGLGHFSADLVHARSQLGEIDVAV